MDRSSRQVDALQVVLWVIGGLFFLPLFAMAVFAVKGDKVGMAASVAVMVMLVLGGLVMGGIAVGASYTRSTMKDGARIALASQDFNDKWDERKMAHTTKLFIEGARAGRALQQPDVPALPLPSQGMDWLPPVSLLEPGNEEWD